MRPESDCVVCGARAAHFHHITGRGNNGKQLDDHLGIFVCVDDHVLLHADLANAHLNKPLTSDETPTLIGRRLRRTALTFSRVIEVSSLFLWLFPFCLSFNDWADELDGYMKRPNAKTKPSTKE